MSEQDFGHTGIKTKIGKTVIYLDSWSGGCKTGRALPNGFIMAAHT